MSNFDERICGSILILTIILIGAWASKLFVVRLRYVVLQKFQNAYHKSVAHRRDLLQPELYHSMCKYLFVDKISLEGCTKQPVHVSTTKTSDHSLQSILEDSLGKVDPFLI